MSVFDAHCDLLYKLYFNYGSGFALNSYNLEVTLENLYKGGVKVQCFAIYIPPEVHPSMRFFVALAQIDLFYQIVIKQGGLKFIASGSDLRKMKPNEIGAVLTLEGCDCINEDIVNLRTLLRLGVNAIGLTWNFANCVADGVGESRGAGLSQFGKIVVMELNDEEILCDVSHLSERGFWDIISLAKHPIASHSNAKKITPHERNLTDDQFRALVKRDGVVGITFVPEFLSTSSTANITDVLRHLEHFCSLGGKNNVGFGSDFDGTSSLPYNLKSAAAYDRLGNELLKYYASSDVKGFLYGNFARKFQVVRNNE